VGSNPYNKPKPLGKINHSKPRIFARNQTETHTQKTKPFLRFATIASTTNTKKPIISLSQRRPLAPFLPCRSTSSPGNPYIENQNPCIFNRNQTQQTHTQQPIPSKPKPIFPILCFFHRIGFTVFFSQKPNKTFCLVSVKKTQQTHALFLLLCNRTHMLSIPLHLFIFISFSSIASLPVEPDPPDVIFLLC